MNKPKSCEECPFAEIHGLFACMLSQTMHFLSALRYDDCKMKKYDERKNNK